MSAEHVSITDLIEEASSARIGLSRTDRKAAEQTYACAAFDFVRDPIGSRDWCLFWDGWRASRTHALQVAAEFCRTHECDDLPAAILALTDGEKK